MAQCKRLEGCPFFKNMEHLPRTAQELANTYCHKDNRGCARLWVLSNGVRPPDDLFPNERNRALRILSESGRIPTDVLATVQHHSKSWCVRCGVDHARIQAQLESQQRTAR